MSVNRWRTVGAVALGLVAIWQGVGTATAAYATFATGDYRPILVRGVWAAVWALLALQGSAAVAGGWKARAASLVGALLVVVPLANILRRLMWLER